jgi:hypothetical protein
MRTRMAWPLALCLLTAAAFATWSLTPGQDPTSPQPPRTSPMPNPAAAGQVPASPAAAPSAPPTSLIPGDKPSPARDLSRLTPLQQQMYFGAQRGADWLYRLNRTDGRFVYGYLPAVSAVMEGDHYLRQAGAAYALARAARFTNEERYVARATQAVLTLLGDTGPDPKDPQIRFTSLPQAVVNRLAAAGLLVLAINELPSPQDDLLKQSEQLCNYVRRMQRADGSLCYTDNPEDPKADAADPDGINNYPGVALYGLMRSQQLRPAAWKTELVRRALGYYQPWWRGHKNMGYVPWQTAAFAEAFAQTKEQAFGDYVNEMNDWICTLQYDRLDPRHPTWVGGFMTWQDGRAVEAAPQVTSASCAEGLAEACRVARAAGDLPRFRRYSEALERCLQFVTMLQYTDANTQHFAAWYRPRLVGGFHASDQDGNLRIDYTQHAVCALVQYLTYVAPLP